eukprot:gb/GEZN01011899.1/.p1 GENE.gb/GEZN01011899.1/~~gb/GEZN01011899.1/.p1  ORF type:complete len:244 (+),score=27.61 gb/GEZN01011899.1/:64-732(+)
MNIFRFAGDMMHLLSIFIILLKIVSVKNCRGISLKTQALYLLVFITRYLDIFYTFHLSVYNFVMKIIFIGSSGMIVWLMAFKRPYCDTYEKKKDSFNVLFVIIPCAVLALLVNEYFSPVEVLWTFSIYLEAVAILPQLIVVHACAKDTQGFVENLTSHYVFSLGSYRALYIINWIYRYYTEPYFSQWIVWIAGAVQTAFYIDFFYFYITAQVTGKQHMSLPI